MKTTARAYLDLVRLPNLFTAAADPLAGFFCNGGSTADWKTCLYMALSSMSLYVGGVALNDVFDANIDAAERPQRPIPSGRISRRSAAIVAVVGLGIGMTVAGTISQRAWLPAGAMVAAIVAYNAGLKSTPLGPMVMGACRALNLLLGIRVAGDALPGSCLVAALLLGVYISSITYFGRDEAGVSSARRLTCGLIGIHAAMAGLVALQLAAPGRDSSGCLLVLGMVYLVGPPGFRALRHRSAGTVQAAMKNFVLAIIVFDAAIAWTGGGWPAAGWVLPLFVPATVLGWCLRVT